MINNAAFLLFLATVFSSETLVHGKRQVRSKATYAKEQNDLIDLSREFNDYEMRLLQLSTSLDSGNGSTDAPGGGDGVITDPPADGGTEAPVDGRTDAPGDGGGDAGGGGETDAPAEDTTAPVTGRVETPAPTIAPTALSPPTALPTIAPTKNTDSRGTGEDSGGDGGGSAGGDGDNGDGSPSDSPDIQASSAFISSVTTCATLMAVICVSLL
ncbi:unnamed protein product [Cylindrotheca closterium]|uniref:Uncharacterized protein n=1 Tax=Cylindrotheca closterium TaxID=2856 RepID=A0AAD2FWL6_9STRA|nr:unnamed protein product [Cylindrotheca closterium]